MGTKIAGRKYWQPDFIAMSKKHYTLYPNFKNITGNLHHISLIDAQIKPKAGPQKSLNILLGTAYRDICSRGKRDLKKKVLITKLQNLILQHKISLYLPHPGDETKYFANCEQIIPEAMAENLIIDLIYQGYKINLFGFAGTTQFNLASSSEVTNFALYDTSLLSDKINNAVLDIADSSFTKINLNLL